MPKKTKKEKIIATYRRKLKLIQNQQINIPIKQDNEISIPIPNAVIEKKQSLSEDEQLITLFFFKDLKKSLILIIFIIALEFFLYFATIKQYLKF